MPIHSSILKKIVLVLGLCGAFCLAMAQQNPDIKFKLDSRIDGSSSFFILPLSRGYFKEAKLDVRVDAGTSSTDTVNRVASGLYDIAFCDLGALMEFHANNPEATNKPVAVMMVYNNTPTSIIALKKSGIKTTADLNGKRLGAPAFDIGRRNFPIFARANHLRSVSWINMAAPMRETMLLRGDVDAVTDLAFTALLNIEAQGIKPDELVNMNYSDFGVRLYGNVIIASPKMLKERPTEVRAFLTAVAKGAREVMTQPSMAIEAVKARDASIDKELETRRLELLINTVINSADGRKEGFGQVYGPRLSLMAHQLSEAYNTKTRVRAEDIWDGSFLPTNTELDVLPKSKK